MDAKYAALCLFLVLAFHGDVTLAGLCSLHLYLFPSTISMYILMHNRDLSIKLFLCIVLFLQT